MTTKTKPKDRRIEQITLRASQAERDRLTALAKVRGTEIAEVIRLGVNLIATKEGRPHVFRT